MVRKHIYREFIKLYLPMLAVVLVAAWSLTYAQHRLWLDRLEQQQAHAVRLERQVLEGELVAHGRDVHFLAEVFQHRLRGVSGPAQVRPNMFDAGMLADVVAFMDTRRSYDQIRLLDYRGHEVLRINAPEDGTPYRVADEDLQDKSHRHYFIGAQQLAEDDIYLSPLDLNIENGRIEMPIKPMLRFSRALRDAEGRLLGVMVLNYKAGILLRNIRENTGFAPGIPLLANGDGFWLVGASDEEEWGFHFADRNDRNIQVTRPELWQALSVMDAGTVETPNGICTFSVIRPGLTLRRSMGDDWKSGGSDRWFLISHLERADIAFQPDAYFLWATGLLVVGMAVVCWFWARTRVTSREQQAALDSSRDRILAMSRASHDAMVIINDSGHVDFWNPSAETILGYTPEEAVGQDVHRLLASPEEYGQAKAGLARFANSGRGDVVGSVLELEAKCKDESRVPVELSVSSFRVHGAWYAVGMMRDITERKEAEEKLRRLATTDTLTGLCNRRQFMEIAERELDRAKRYGRPLALIMCDVDHFKQVNDTYGHNVGDEVLKALAVIMAESLREPDVMARLGGEEFAAVLTEAGQDGGREVAERLRRAVEREPLQTSAGGLRITVSVGLAPFMPGIDTVERLLGCADKALYEAKNSGRNRVAACAEPL